MKMKRIKSTGKQPVFHLELKNAPNFKRAIMSSRRNELVRREHRSEQFSLRQMGGELKTQGEQVTLREKPKETPLDYDRQEILLRQFRLVEAPKYLSVEDLFDELSLKEEAYQKSFIVTKKMLGRLMEKFREEVYFNLKCDSRDKILRLEKENLQLIEKNSMLNYVYRELRQQNLHPFNNLCTQLKDFDPDWKSKSKKAIGDLVGKKQEEYEPMLRKYEKALADLQQANSQIEENRKLIEQLLEVVDRESLAEQKFHLNFQKISDLIQSYLRLKERSDTVNSAYEEYMTLKHKMKEVEEESLRRAMAKCTSEFEAQIIHSQRELDGKRETEQRMRTEVCELREKLLEQSMTLGEKEAKINQLTLEAFENNKLILKLRIDMAKEGQEKQFYRSQLQSITKQFNQKIFKERRELKKYSDLNEELRDIVKKLEAEILKLLQVFKGTEHSELILEKVEFINYLSGQRSRVSSSIIDQLKSQLRSNAVQNQLLREALGKADHSLLAARQQEQNIASMLKQMSIILTMTIASSQKQIKRIKSLSQCVICYEVKGELQQIKDILGNNIKRIQAFFKHQ